MFTRWFVGGYTALLLFAAVAISFIGASSPGFAYKYGMTGVALGCIAALGSFVTAALVRMEQHTKALERRTQALEGRQQAADAQPFRPQGEQPAKPQPAPGIQAGRSEQRE